MNKTKDITVDIYNSEHVDRFNTWCEKNLETDEWEYVVMRMIPLWFRYKFYCPKTKVLALLST